MLKILLKLCCVFFCLSTLAQAKQVIIPAPPKLATAGHLLMDVHTGKVIVEHNAELQLPPASLTKMMTSYLVSAEVHRGRITEEDMVPISVKAWNMKGSRMFIREGTQVSVKDLLRGVIIQSGNDASVALAEFVAGGEDAFVDVMNQQAQLLGMTGTTYKNSTGWPAEGHLTTPRDLALLGRALIRDYPEHYKLYAEKYFKYNGISQGNRNKLLFKDSSVDGIKTGHTEEAGYCLVSSAERDNMRLLAVVMGTKSESSRTTESQKLLSYGFRYYQTHKVYATEDELSNNRIWYGEKELVSLGVKEDLYLTIPRGAQKNLKATMHVDEVIEAPVKLGQELGNLVVKLGEETLLDVPLVAKHAVEEAGFFAGLMDGVQLFFHKLFSLE